MSLGTQIVVRYVHDDKIACHTIEMLSLSLSDKRDSFVGGVLSHRQKGGGISYA